jgi:hypothetical protein
MMPLPGFAIQADSVHIGLNNVNELVGVRLHMSALILRVTGTLNIRLCAVTDQVVVLAVLYVFEQAVWYSVPQASSLS